MVHCFNTFTPKNIHHAEYFWHASAQTLKYRWRCLLEKTYILIAPILELGCCRWLNPPTFPKLQQLLQYYSTIKQARFRKVLKQINIEIKIQMTLKKTLIFIDSLQNILFADCGQMSMQKTASFNGYKTKVQMSLISKSLKDLKG